MSELVFYQSEQDKRRTVIDGDYRCEHFNDGEYIVIKRKEDFTLLFWHGEEYSVKCLFDELREAYENFHNPKPDFEILFENEDIVVCRYEGKTIYKEGYWFETKNGVIFPNKTERLLNELYAKAKEQE